MTPTRAAIRATVAVSPILALLAAASCGTSRTPVAPSPPPATTSSPPTGNRSPVIDSITLTPFGVSGLTPISMSASASDPDGDSVTLTWSFNGSTVAGPTVSTTLQGDGPVTVTLTVTDGKGGATTGVRTVTIGTMTGRWNYIPTGGSACGFYGFSTPPVLTLSQVGNAITGTMASPVAWCNVPAGTAGVIDPAGPGTITAGGAITFRLKLNPLVDSFFTTQMDQTGRECTGSEKMQNFTGTWFHTLRKIS